MNYPEITLIETINKARIDYREGNKNDILLLKEKK